MAQRGGTSAIHYKETKGLKKSGGQFVKKGAILTREGDKWKAGINVRGKSTLCALCDGEVYFTNRRGTYRTRKSTKVINIKAVKPKLKA
ncbi:50S ribosomal protein L27 [Candidatus Omnitrophota bacterium]